VTTRHGAGGGFSRRGTDAYKWSAARGSPARAPGRPAKRSRGSERLQAPCPQAVDRSAGSLRPPGQAAGATGPGRKAPGRGRGGQTIPVSVRLLPRHRLPPGFLPRVTHPGRRPTARPGPHDRGPGRAGHAGAGAEPGRDRHPGGGQPAAERVDEDHPPVADK